MNANVNSSSHGIVFSWLVLSYNYDYINELIMTLTVYCSKLTNYISINLCLILFCAEREGWMHLYEA